MLQMRKGLFGAGMPDLTGSVSHNLPTTPVAQPMAQPEGPKFATPGTWQNKALMVGDILLAASRGQSSPMLGQQAMMQQQAAAAQQQRGQEWEDYVKRYQYELANPKPKTANPTSLQQNYEWLKATNPKAADAYLERMTNNYEYRQGADGRFYRIDIGEGAQPQVLGDTLPDGWAMDEGGPSQPATGGFRP